MNQATTNKDQTGTLCNPLNATFDVGVGAYSEPALQRPTLLNRENASDISILLMLNQAKISHSIIALTQIDFGKKGNRIRNKQIKLLKKASKENSDLHAVLEKMYLP